MSRVHLTQSQVTAAVSAILVLAVIVWGLYNNYRQINDIPALSPVVIPEIKSAEDLEAITQTLEAVDLESSLETSSQLEAEAADL